jgi:hypothetical protein
VVLVVHNDVAEPISVRLSVDDRKVATPPRDAGEGAGSPRACADTQEVYTRFPQVGQRARAGIEQGQEAVRARQFVAPYPWNRLAE